MTRIASARNGFKNYTLDGHEIGDVIFYGAGGIYYRSRRGWLEAFDWENDGPGRHAREVLGLDIETPVRANKENLNRTDNYFITTRLGTYKASDPSRYILYIYLPTAPEDLGEHVSYEGSTEIHYQSFSRFKVGGSVQDWDFTGDPVYPEYREYRSVPQAAQELVLAVGSRSVRKEFGNEVDRVSQELVSKGIDLPGHLLVDLLKVYTLVPRA